MLERGFRAGTSERVDRRRRCRRGSDRLMRYLVTGGTGFVGAFVVRELLATGHDVVALDLQPDPELLAGVLSGTIPPNVDVVRGDVSDAAGLLEIMSAVEPERVVHLAGMLSRGSAANPLLAIKVNCEGTVNVFDAALAVGASKVAWASTIAVFGWIESGGVRIANDAPQAPGSVYGATKSFCERIGAFYKSDRGLDNVGLRFTAAYGHGKIATLARGTGAMESTELLEKPARGEPGRIENANDVVDWLYVEDAAYAVRLAAEAPPGPSPAVTICGDARPMAEAIAYVRQLLPDAQIEAKSDGPGLVQNFDPSAAKTEIGYQKRFSMEEGFRKTIEIVRSVHGLPPLPAARAS
jgi:UDP-glucose 4-epimerase